ncbi:CRAL/TRIO domain-containing protein [Heliocybe sulcata]|uniref:CRAL/TRIO domain-containing protein n=1 Tax=Heliocybe sulcata TaxID=5364 RepID=A0A5C3N676_9AGAM|nr:CRAL/TRIO domain-containing protein [Heliocybe sulcata]
MSNSHSGHDILSGHPGHLTPDQEQALSTFKQNLSSTGAYKPGSDSTPTSHDDAILLRFLRARKFDLQKAQKQFLDAESWRKENDIENLYANFDPQEFEAAKHFYPRWTGRRDKQGVPVYVYRLAALSGPVLKELQAVPQERRRQRITALWEFMTRFTTPLCTALPHPGNPPTPIVAVTSIIDFADCSVGTLWSLRSHLQQASTMATANYPETLHSVAVVNAPSYFGTVWGWIKNWFDEGTRNKIHVLGTDPGPTLLKLIDAENLPKMYGGQLDFKFEDEPNLDEDARKLIGDSVPKGPCLFVDGKVVIPERTAH